MKYIVAIVLISVQPFRLFCQLSPEYLPIDQLARSITVNCRTEKQKVDSVISWVVNYLTYDRAEYESYRTGVRSPLTLESVLTKKMAVCDGYALLTETLLNNAGVQAVAIRGFAKSSGADLFEDTVMLAHAWNAVKINNKWELLDVTWTDNYMEAGDSSMFFCYTEPGKFIWSHYPRDLQWSLVSGAPTLEEFLGRPVIHWDVIAKYGLQIPEITRIVEKNVFTTAQSIFIENKIPEQYQARMKLQDIHEEGFTDAEITYINEPKRGCRIVLPRAGSFTLEVTVMVKGPEDLYLDYSVITAKVIRTKK